MKDFRTLKTYTILIGVLVLANGIYSFLEILNIWNVIQLEFSAFSSLKYQFYTQTDKFIATTYQLLNIALLIPVFLFFKISNQFKNGTLYSNEIINLLKNICTILYVLSAIAILTTRFVKPSELYQTPNYWFNIHPLFFMFLGTIFSAFAVILKEALKQKQENELTI